jgi:flavin-dependent dehydrogenase
MESMSQQLVVVGGGPVGLYAATFAAKAGWSVTLVEARDGDGDKACGEGLMPDAVRSLAEIGVHPRGVEFRGIRYVSADGKRQVESPLSGGHGIGVRRTGLVRALRGVSDACGVSRLNGSVVRVRNGHDGATVSLADGSDCTGKYLLACDGLSSTVRTELDLDEAVREKPRYGIRRHFNVRPWTDHVEVHWSTDAEAYVTPVDNRLVGVALLGARGGSFEERLMDFPALRQRLSAAEAVGDTRGAGPLRRRSRHRVEGRVLLVGDAGGYVDALTGEGLAVGFLSARAAVRAIAAGNVTAYEDEWRDITRRFRWSTEALLRATQLRPLRSALLPLATTTPSTFRRIVAVMT